MKVIFTHTTRKAQKEYEAEATVYITSGYKLAMIELQGATTAVRAMWAHLVKYRGDGETMTDIQIKVGSKWESVYVPTNKKFQRKEKSGYVLLWSPDWEAKSRKFMLGGDLDNPPIHFMEAFRINVPDVPFLFDWAPQLWKIGLEKELIVPLTTFDSLMNAWEFKVKASGYYGADWEDLVKELVRNGAISSN